MNWWLYGRSNETLRNAIRNLDRMIISSVTSKHRFFVFASKETHIDSTAFAVAVDDALYLGVMSSKIYLAWVLAAGGTLEDRPRFNKGSCFDPFPFPVDDLASLKARIRAEAEALDALRKRVLAEHADLTLTKLYNVLEALREGRALTPQERDIHDRGLVTLIRQHHEAIDEGVADAYGWGDEHRARTLDEETILSRLVALNKERAAEEARGLVRYLRPEFQDPGYRAPVATTLDLAEAAVGAGQQRHSLAGHPARAGRRCAVDPRRRARAARGRGTSPAASRASALPASAPVLDALAGLGMARRLNDGRYAA